MIRDLAFHQEVLDFLGRQARIEVVASCSDAAELDLPDRGSGRAGLDAVVMCPVAAAGFASGSGSDLPPAYLVAEEMTVPVLRSAIEVGAQGAFCWPEERADLAHAVAASRRNSVASSHVRAQVVAVLGARGGVGVTFVASHLAAAFARSGRHTVLVDMDPAFGDLTPALGLVEDDGLSSIEDLVPVIDELSPDHVSHALIRHEAGFDVLLSRSFRRRAAIGASNGNEEPIAIPAGLYGASVALVACDHDVVVLHVPRTLGTLAKAAVRLADETILVIGPDLMSLYGARRTLGALRADALGTNLRVVRNDTRRPEASDGEVERVLGVKPAARIRPDPSVVNAQAAGRVLGRRGGRAWRDVAALAAILAQAPAARVGS